MPFLKNNNNNNNNNLFQLKKAEPVDVDSFIPLFLASI